MINKRNIQQVISNSPVRFCSFEAIALKVALKIFLTCVCENCSPHGNALLKNLITGIYSFCTKNDLDSSIVEPHADPI